jgi:hypothetical protein
MTMQNLVLAVQNTVALRDIGAASSSVAFFRSLGGTVGVSVLGAVLAHRVTGSITRELAAAGIPASASGKSSNLNVDALPDPVQHIVRVAYGDATGHIFLLSAIIAVVGVIAAALLKPRPLRTSLDLVEPKPDGGSGAGPAAGSSGAEPTIGSGAGPVGASDAAEPAGGRGAIGPAAGSSATNRARVR